LVSEADVLRYFVFGLRDLEAKADLSWKLEQKVVSIAMADAVALVRHRERLMQLHMPAVSTSRVKKTAAAIEVHEGRPNDPSTRLLASVDALSAVVAAFGQQAMQQQHYRSPPVAGRGRGPIRCFNCNKLGHIRCNCPDLAPATSAPALWASSKPPVHASVTPEQPGKV
jgi:hypothetical protein